MKLFWRYLRDKKTTFVTIFLFTVLFVISFRLYHLPLKAVLYPALLCTVLGFILLLINFSYTVRQHRKLSTLRQLSAELIDTLPAGDHITDDDYREIIRMLCRENQDLSEASLRKYRDMVDYYTVWAHQIKTPIASMRLTLQNEDTPLSRKLQLDLNRIEGYVQMVLTFLRLDMDSTDYLLRTCDMDALLLPILRRFSGEFIAKHLTLSYDPIHRAVLTDEKWLSFVLEQIISNAVKYTPSGVISLNWEEPSTLCIRDTGIGIAPEDLPRIFQNGFTGCNGRTDKRATGIGLYLCKRICDRLGHTISVTSVVNEGTTVCLDLSRRDLHVE